MSVLCKQALCSHTLSVDDMFSDQPALCPPDSICSALKEHPLQPWRPSGSAVLCCEVLHQHTVEPSLLPVLRAIYTEFLFVSVTLEAIEDQKVMAS